MKTQENYQANNQEDRTRWGIYFAVIGAAVVWLTLIAATWADAAESDEYNFNWLDPEKKIYVLQNRRYLKANRLLITGMVGAGISNPYRNVLVLDPRLAYYFSEAFGMEAFYKFGMNTHNATYDALLSTTSNVSPVVRELRSQMGLLAHWVPWYAKINVFNKILYFDWYFSGGAGSLNTAVNTTRVENFQNQSLFGLYFGTGHQYHLSDHFTVRLDFTGTFYNASSTGLSGNETWFSNYDFAIGLGLRI